MSNRGGHKVAYTPWLEPTVVATFISSGFAYILYKRKQFSEVITRERINYIKHLREHAIGFCEQLDAKECNSAKLTNHYYALQFLFNPTTPSNYWDKEIVELLDHLYKNHENKQTAEFRVHLDKFIRCLQADLGLEWHGFYKESIQGQLSQKKKEELRFKFFKNYRNNQNSSTLPMKKYLIYKIFAYVFCTIGIIATAYVISLLLMDLQKSLLFGISACIFLWAYFFYSLSEKNENDEEWRQMQSSDNS